jgi:hypothetical protein
MAVRTMTSSVPCEGPRAFFFGAEMGDSTEGLRTLEITRGAS